MPLRRLTKIDSEIFQLRVEIEEGKGTEEKLKRLDKLIEERFAFIRGLPHPLRSHAQSRPKP